MHWELVVPGLIAAARELRLPAAELLIARGRHTAEEPLSLESWLAAQFDLGEAPLPAGALTLLAHRLEPGSERWARADPVHLRLLRDRIALVPAEAFDLRADESDALRETLVRHFAGRMEIRAPEPKRWCVRLGAEVQAAPGPALERAGADLSPAGAIDALSNEIQMALHEHPVNEAREARGEPAVNGLWLWGAGASPGKAHARWQSLHADEPSALGLARLAGLRHRALPESAGALLGRSPEDGRHAVLLDALRAPLALGDVEAARRAALALEAQWFAPLLDALRAWRVGMVTVHVPDAGLAAETIRGDLRRFWRRARPLATMAP